MVYPATVANLAQFRTVTAQIDALRDRSEVGIEVPGRFQVVLRRRNSPFLSHRQITFYDTNWPADDPAARSVARRGNVVLLRSGTLCMGVLFPQDHEDEPEFVLPQVGRLISMSRPILRSALVTAQVPSARLGRILSEVREMFGIRGNPDGLVRVVTWAPIPVAWAYPEDSEGRRARAVYAFWDVPPLQKWAEAARPLDGGRTVPVRVAPPGTWLTRWGKDPAEGLHCYREAPV